MFALLYCAAHVGAAAPDCKLQRLQPYVTADYCRTAAKQSNSLEVQNKQHGQWFCVESKEWQPVAEE